MRKPYFAVIMALLALLFVSCRPSVHQGVCRIHGTIPAQWNDRQIFLVPLTNDSRWNVDSVYIKDGKFEFETDTLMMAKIIVDYHYRMGLQTLLVVVEPGDVTVEIGAQSSAKGTPLNDSLDHWKKLTEFHNRELAALRAEKQDERADSVHLAYKLRTRQTASNLKGTVLGDFLQSLYPLTYKRKMSDGSVKTFNSDTNEEVR